MTTLNEIQKEVLCLKSILSAKSTNLLKTRNVRILFQTGKLAQLTKEFNNCELIIR